MAFDITSVLQGTASAPDTGREQIEYIPLDSLDPDENNFYSLDGLEDLAGNIELIGLQQPLRVRPGETEGRYTVVSGHRRREAIRLIRDGGSEQFRDGVPCIVERGEASPALRELRLIYANAATRVMSAAEISKQAERVEELLYRLKEKEYMVFPGRMRDHVAQACRVSKSKLARLKAIRNHLVPELLERFDRGEMSEELAYQMARLPPKAQTQAAELLSSGKQKNLPYAWVVEKIAQNYSEYTAKPKCAAHAGLPDCGYTVQHIVRSLWEPYDTCWECTRGSGHDWICCRECVHRNDCKKACRACVQRRELDQAVEKEKAAEKAKKEAAEQELQQKQYRKLRQEQARRVLDLAEKLQLADDAELPAANSWTTPTTIANVRKMAAGDFGNQVFYDITKDMIPTSTKNLQEWADTLHCSTDCLLGRGEAPQQKVSGPDTGEQWQTGRPPRSGLYAIKCGIPEEEGSKWTAYRIVVWTGDAWVSNGPGTPVRENVYGWHKLPEE